MFSSLNQETPGLWPGVFFCSQQKVKGTGSKISGDGDVCLGRAASNLHPEMGCSGFAGNDIAESQGQVVCEIHDQACIIHGMRMLLISPRKPSRKAGKSIEAVLAEPRHPEYCGFGKGSTFAIKLRAEGTGD